MAEYRKKPVVIEARQWRKNGDHPFVAPFWKPEYDTVSDWTCPQCGETYLPHGWIATLEGGHRVCPSDWIITGVKGVYPCKPDIFEATYESVD